MTHRELRRVEADGTRVYHNYRKYRPLSMDERTYGIRKPDDPRAVRFHTRWFLPLELLDDRVREMPRTRPDEDGVSHRMLCECDICKNNENVVRLKRRALGIAPRSTRGSSAPSR